MVWAWLWNLEQILVPIYKVRQLDQRVSKVPSSYDVLNSVLTFFEQLCSFFLPFLRGLHCVEPTTVSLVLRYRAGRKHLILEKAGPTAGCEWTGKRQLDTVRGRQSKNSILCTLPA